MGAKHRGVGNTDDLIQRVFHHGGGKPRRNVAHGGAVLLCLLDRGVHKHRATRAEIDRGFGKQPQLGKFLHAVPERLGKRFNKRAATRGARFVEHNAVNGVIADLEALDVLPADVEDKADLRVKERGGGKVRHGLHQPVIHMERVADQFLAVPGDGTAENFHPVAAKGIDFLQLFLDNGNRVAFVGAVISIKDFPVFADEHQFGGGGAAVHAEIRAARVGVKALFFHRGARVARGKGGVLPLVGKQRRQAHAARDILRRLLNVAHQIVIRKGP